MSGGALFSNNAVRGASKNLVEFKAGKMTMKGKMVYPDTRKGLLYVYQSDDSLMHLCWKDRTSGVIEDDLIIFPDDCDFKPVPACKTGRVVLLRFKLTNKKFFFWLQDLKTDKDAEHCCKVNEALNNPPTPGSQRSGGPNHEGDLQNILNNMSQQQLIQLFGGVGQIGLGNLLGTMRDRPHTRTATTTASSPVTTTATRPPAAQTPVPSTTDTRRTPKSSGKPANIAITDPHLFDLQRHLWNISTPPGAEPVVQWKLLRSVATAADEHMDVSMVSAWLWAFCCSQATAELIVRQRGVVTELTNSIPAAISSTDSLERTMSEHLPPGDSLCTTLSSPQFSQALSMFWSALQSGQAGPVVRQFGLGADAVNAAATGNLEEFISELENEAKVADDDSEAKKDDEEKKEEKKEDKDDEMALD